MKTLDIRNKELRVILDKYLTSFLAFDRSALPYRTHTITADYACSEEYLAHMQGKKVDGFPEQTHGVDLSKYTPPNFSEPLRTFDTNVMSWSGCRYNAVKMVYPKGGYMGWHHNANAPGYNVLFSWSERGLGYFKYQDPITKEFVVFQDTPGWTCKVGYFGDFSQPDKMIWHCANAKNEERVTLAYVIPHEGMWSSMCEDIETV